MTQTQLKPPKAELLKSLPMEEYHADRSRLSKSMISDFADCPARFKHRYIDDNPREETDSLRVGKAIHTLALEPELWAAEYVVLDVDKRTKAGKEEWAEAEASGKTILRQKQYEDIEGMANALTRNPLALALLKSPGYVEATIHWDHEGIPAKCRPDFLRNDGLIIDLKTCRSAKPSLFHRDAENYHYALSVALTCSGYESLHGKPADNYVFLCVETEAPYIIECYESMAPMDEVSGLTYLEYGRYHLEALLNRYRECLAANHWPTYSGKIEPMKAPAWAVNKAIMGEAA